MTTEQNKEWARGLLRSKYEELGRFPKKDDFDEISRSRIKAFLGPWPRALESAGIKECTKPSKRKKRKRSSAEKEDEK